MGGYTGIKTPRGFHNQTLPLAFPLVVAGTVCRQGLCSIRDLPPRPLQGLGRSSLSLVPKVTPQTSHQEACSPLAGLASPRPLQGLRHSSLSLVPNVTPQTSHQEACSPLAGLTSTQKAGRIYKINNSQPWKSLLVFSIFLFL